MATERNWLAVTATPLMANGTQFGVVTIADTNGYKVKGYAFIAANTLTTQQLQIQRVISSTQLILGPLGTSPSPNNFTNLSAFTTALDSTIGFPEQPKNKIKPDDIEQATYEADPTVAVRVIPVDPYGGLIGPDNPMAVTFDGTIAIGQVEIKGSPSGDLLNVNPDGSIDVNATVTIPSGTIPTTWTDIKLAYNSNNDLIQVQFYNGIVVERTLTLSYDSNDNLTDVLPS